MPTNNRGRQAATILTLVCAIFASGCTDDPRDIESVDELRTYLSDRGVSCEGYKSMQGFENMHGADFLQDLAVCDGEVSDIRSIWIFKDAESKGQYLETFPAPSGEHPADAWIVHGKLWAIGTESEAVAEKIAEEADAEIHPTS